MKVGSTSSSRRARRSTVRRNRSGSMNSTSTPPGTPRRSAGESTTSCSPTEASLRSTRSFIESPLVQRACGSRPRLRRTVTVVGVSTVRMRVLGKQDFQRDRELLEHALLAGHGDPDDEGQGDREELERPVRAQALKHRWVRSRPFRPGPWWTCCVRSGGASRPAAWPRSCLAVETLGDLASLGQGDDPPFLADDDRQRVGLLGDPDCGAVPGAEAA